MPVRFSYHFLFSRGVTNLVAFGYFEQPPQVTRTAFGPASSMVELAGLTMHDDVLIGLPSGGTSVSQSAHARAFASVPPSASIPPSASVRPHGSRMVHEHTLGVQPMDSDWLLVSSICGVQLDESTRRCAVEIPQPLDAGPSSPGEGEPAPCPPGSPLPGRRVPVGRWTVYCSSK
jgi:hypothetical protein